ncbi:MAG: 3-dehydroquinate synthase [Nitrospinae bacterium]|nr:3-dehydroquinate synthase [Nitrospinota bacterium]
MDVSAGNSNNTKQFQSEEYKQEFMVRHNYPVCFTRDLFSPRNPLLASILDRFKEGRKYRAAVFVDSGVAKAHPSLMSRIEKYFKARKEMELAFAPVTVPGGEKAKRGWKHVKEIMRLLNDHHLCRHSYVAAIGGGAVLDMVGFASSIVHRGLRVVRVPTTVLAQNDAGVGVKNGIDDYGAKNFAGTFSPPFAVLNDFNFLHTLSGKEWKGGIAEAFKVAIIKDREFLEFLCENAVALGKRDLPLMEKMIRRCAILHLEHIRNSGDPFESGSARPLDFGHWSAHRMEVASNYRIGHGQAVAVGIALDSFYAMRLGLLSRQEFQMIIEALAASGLPLWYGLLEKRGEGGRLDILEGLGQFQEHLGGGLSITLPQGLGKKCDVHRIEEGIVEEAVRYFKDLGQGQPFSH